MEGSQRANNEALVKEDAASTSDPTAIVGSEGEFQLVVFTERVGFDPLAT